MHPHNDDRHGSRACSLPSAFALRTLYTTRGSLPMAGGWDGGSDGPPPAAYSLLASPGRLGGCVLDAIYRNDGPPASPTRSRSIRATISRVTMWFTGSRRSRKLAVHSASRRGQASAGAGVRRGQVAGAETRRKPSWKEKKAKMGAETKVCKKRTIIPPLIIVLLRRRWCEVRVPRMGFLGRIELQAALLETVPVEQEATIERRMGDTKVYCWQRCKRRSADVNPTSSVARMRIRFDKRHSWGLHALIVGQKSDGNRTATGWDLENSVWRCGVSEPTAVPMNSTDL
ncbi:hypothetical protein C8R44DRAFT_905962 [Mycena epipterygia]|nr:hypothetical protein C8R44DRAFT_905962 [Mycena epipterygia]